MFISHIQESTKQIQSVAEHSYNTAKYAVDRCYINELKDLVYLACVLHDAGKNTEDFADYIKKASENNTSVRKGDVVHSTAGGCIITKLISESTGRTKEFVAELIRHAIISHHGMCDCITPDGVVTFYRRAEREKNLSAIEKEVYSYLPKEELNKRIEKACIEINELLKRIVSITKRDERLGDKYFYYGLVERLLLSLLVDADRTDTACFMDIKTLPQAMDNDKIQALWQELVNNLEVKISEIKTDKPIDIYRQEISECCKLAANEKSGIFRLIVPTGAGKTISSLRYALNHAMLYSKRRIIYVAPYNSILEQNANVIRKMIGDKNLVLEHHCNIVIEEDGESQRYKELTENWDSPIIATSAVQFLETLFSSKMSSVRRMHTLINSVIIIDEIQFIPVKCISLFNLAMNYLTEICNTSVVLCSATQPLLDKLPSNRLIEPKDMVIDSEKYSAYFRRVKIIDDTNYVAGGFKINYLAEYIAEKIKNVQNLLVIVNTKSCAKDLYINLCSITSNFDDNDKPLMYHLSTNMCARHRKKTLDKIIKNLKQKDRKIICVSTSLIEAGVDISFETVVRSLAGLDNIIQAAGRCNRNNEYKQGNVYIVKIADENISRLKDIKKAQDAMNSVLHILHESPELIENDLLSKKAMDYYYTYYFINRMSEMDYNIPEYDTTIVDLLSKNKIGYNNLVRSSSNPPNILLKQAFKTAGDCFNVIEDKDMIDIVVECDRRSKRLINEMNSNITLGQQIRILRQLQIYSVSISGSMKNNLERQNALYQLKNGGIIALRKEYYSLETGVTDIPAKMDPYHY
ncbi:MAG TPA: CRISPR-associated helicase Cas3' [Clostridiaceae bacterium]|nr:CRISPR-associated helicase Cas3' [Clostridiaceae bacterium]